MSIELVSIILVGGVFLLMAIGVPLSFAAGSLAVLVSYFKFGPNVIALAHKTIYGLATEYSLLSVPLFILMATLLERSSLAQDLYDALFKIFGHLKGGVATVTLIISVFMAAISGIIGGEIVLLGLIALPQMMRLQYDRKLSIGIICAGGSLGTMVPPSIVLIIYGLTADVSVQKLFLASFIPGFALASAYFAYIFIRCTLNPNLTPKPAEKTAPFSRRDFLRGILPLFALIMIVFGCIYGGITSITEAAGIAVGMTLVIITLRGELDIKMLWQSLTRTLQSCGIILWVTFGAATLIAVYNLSGGQRYVTGMITGLDVAPVVTIMLMMAIFIILGLFMDWIGILLLTIPIFVPIVVQLGYDPIWFGVLFSLTMQVAFLSPPFGPAAFYLKSVAPPEITLQTIFASLWPFMLIQIAFLVVMLAFPNVALWLPEILK
ncbi:TRAP transporter large permease subunit [Thalassospira sp. TSL5-1]|uniref:TRAP transporter large permease n=1 Tax=Thalassospira sp. TSL5-1 TaxID=1544451 RepID=UPI00095AAC51|nr:TRAP transporter large permease subunit [Thalassospira sp. TSL5-1]OKH88140.1 C4-dicarboxylate ABC transporter permease [Thalassospira sp. TSL5-1]